MTDIVKHVMDTSNCLSKTVNVTARLLKCYFGMSSERIRDTLTVQDIKVAKLVQMVVSMEPTFEALQKGDLQPLRPVVHKGIVYIRGRCDRALLSLLGIDRLPVLARNTRLARLIMIESHEEDHRSSST